MSMFNWNLNELRWMCKKSFLKAKPFSHLFIDDFMNPDLLAAALAAYPKTTDDIPWKQFENQQEVKFACSEVSALPMPCQEVLRLLNGPELVSFLARVSGIPDLRADPEYIGGGLHQIRRGGLLDVHVDFNKHGDDNWRRLNALLFVNHDWQEEYGGHIELWKSKTEPDVKFLPVYNRLVIFETTDTSWHGHPEPLNCPEDRTRKSFATYYYSNNPPKNVQKEFRDTTWARP